MRLVICQFMNIQPSADKPHPFALFNLGFRPFFLFATLFSIVSIGAWTAIYVAGWWPQGAAGYTPSQWHAHEMIFGYAMAVIAGFLLTAVRNWTNIPTLAGWPLALLVLTWLAARILWLLMPANVVPMLLLDLLFNLALAVAIAIPLLKAKQKVQLGIVAKIVLLAMANGSFYLGALGLLEQGIRWGLYSGLYLVLSLIFVMGRRVVPFFIERGVGHPVQITNRAWVDKSSLILMLLFWLVDVFTPYAMLASILAAGLLVVHGVRLAGWHTPGVWKKPLLWVLFVGYGSAVLGFLLKALEAVVAISPYLAVHAFAVGAIGLMTVGMMARISLGHTGRNIQEPPRVLTLISIVLTLVVLARVGLVWLAPQWSLFWLELASFGWLFAFVLLAVAYGPIWVKPRVDGQPG